MSFILGEFSRPIKTDTEPQINVTKVSVFNEENCEKRVVNINKALQI